jgi:hypothetical protein
MSFLSITLLAMGTLHTNLIKLNGIELCTFFGQESLGGLAVRAVGFAEYRYKRLH